MHRTPLQTLRDYGQSPWLADVSAELVRDGGLASWVRDHGIRGFAFGSDGDLRDIQQACEVLLDTWGQSAGRDGHVSASLRGALGDTLHDVRREAALLAATVGRPNFLVAIPASPIGIRALEDSIADGISVDATAIFSLAQHVEVADAYVRGLRRLLRAGGDPALVASLASFPVARVDAEIERRLGDPEDVHLSFGETIALATARLAYHQYRRVFAGHTWELLKREGARPQRCRWAATSAHGFPHYDVMYVEALVGSETVTTVDPSTADSFEHHGICADRLERPVDDARQLIDGARANGVDLDEMWRLLNTEQPAGGPDLLEVIA